MRTIFCRDLMSVFSESVTRLYQRKPADNVKHVSVHLSPVDASSVSELAKPLNVSHFLFQLCNQT